LSLVRASIAECGYTSGFVLRGVEFSLSEGEVLVVTGRSGSGKTTLVRAVTGTISAVGGYIRGAVHLCGRNIAEARPEDIYSCLMYIPQEPWYAIIGYTVHAEICHALALDGRLCTRADFAARGLLHLANRLAHTLSAGEVQRVLWAELSLRGARVLVLDEPLVYLDEASRTSAKRIVEAALGEGVAVLLVDHNPLFWEDFEPRLLVLEGGGVLYYGEWSRRVVEELTNRAPAPRAPRTSRGVYAELRGVWFKYPGGDYVLRGVDLVFEKGVLTAVTGPNGSGKTTLLKVSSGVLKPSRGLVARSGPAIYVPENPLLYFTMPTPREELLLAARGDESRVLDAAEYFGVKRVLDKPLARLSSGERRRVALASAYLYDFAGYFVDEPTGGLDYESALLVLEVLEALAESGKAVVIATHDERAVKRADLRVELKT